MARQIKFRAWDGEKMVYQDEYTFIFDKIGYSAHPTGKPDEWVGIKEIMQSTGLLDKNGKEIWEGDIIESVVLLSESGENLRTVVRWGENGWLANGSLSNHPQWMRNHQPEIIGNIYENPELLDNK